MRGSWFCRGRRSWRAGWQRPDYVAAWSRSGRGLGECGWRGRGWRGHVIGGFLGVVVLLGDESARRGPGRGYSRGASARGQPRPGVGLGGLFGGGVAGDVGPGGGDAGRLGVDGGRGCTLSTCGEEGAGFDAVAFLHVEVGDASEGGGADVDVGLGLDLASAVDDRDEIVLTALLVATLMTWLGCTRCGDNAAVMTRTTEAMMMIFLALIACFLQRPLRGFGCEVL